MIKSSVAIDADDEFGGGVFIAAVRDTMQLLTPDMV